MSGATALVTRKALYLYSYVEKKEDAAFLFVYFRLQYASTIGKDIIGIILSYLQRFSIEYRKNQKKSNHNNQSERGKMSQEANR